MPIAFAGSHTVIHAQPADVMGASWTSRLYVLGADAFATSLGPTNGFECGELAVSCLRRASRSAAS
jgi:hypothetical protein